ncbi:MAG: carboxypeptidase [Armatimonadetes bacterium]|nr:carboxypeptidase [Armatimonadota bacterium]MDE2207101.1 carboxypeptidase [Armatimonadota bacterium]
MPQKIRFDCYYKYHELTRILKALAREYPALLSLASIGRSYEGRDVLLATVTNSATGPASEKPAFWCDGNIHATEVSPSSALLYLLQKLLRGYGSDPGISRCLDTRAFYIVPRVNPDGAEQLFAERPRLLRSSTRPWPYDEEPLEGLEVQDVDGDGRMVQMRIPDPNGAWKVNALEPRLLTRREPTETGGRYFRLMPEGLIPDWDGITLKVKPPKERLDLNRNFPADWRQEFEQGGAGPFPGSEPEVYNLMRFIADHPNITGAISFHTHSGVLLRPYSGQPDEKMPAEDLWTYQKIGERGAEITGYPAASVYHDFRYHPQEVITGVFDDWMFEHVGVFAWTCEIWAPQAHAGIVGRKFIEWYREHPAEDDIKMLTWADSLPGGSAWQDWRPFKHPQLGDIELGGWDYLYAFRNPPPCCLEAEIAPLADWAIFHCLISPLMELRSATARRLRAGVWLVQVVVENTGWLPSYVTKTALQHAVVRDVVAEIELPQGAKLCSGKLRMECGQLEGRAYKTSAPGPFTTDASTERAKIEWVVESQTAGEVQVTVRHQRAGVVRATIRLEAE